MKHLVITLLIFTGGAALADTDINESMDADPDSEIYISNISGSVEVDGWSRSEVEITGSLGSGVEELEFERDGSEIIINVKTRRNNSRGIATDLVVKVPDRSELYINTVSADIDVDNVTGEQRLESVSGEVTTAAFDEDVDIESVSGSIEVVGDNKDMRSRFESVSGNIETENLAGEIHAESVSGEVIVSGGSFDRAGLGTVNGAIVFHAELRNGGRLDIESINGGVDVDFGGDVSARFDIESFNGNIRNCFGPEPVRTSRYAPGTELSFTEGGGDGRVTIETLNGNLRLCK